MFAVACAERIPPVSNGPPGIEWTIDERERRRTEPDGDEGQQSPNHILAPSHLSAPPVCALRRLPSEIVFHLRM